MSGDEDFKDLHKLFDLDKETATKAIGRGVLVDKDGEMIYCSDEMHHELMCLDEEEL